MASLYIHVGYHKTGTTAIQNYLWAHRAELAAAGVCYPEIGLSGPTHGKLANVFRGEAFRGALQQMRPLPGPEEFDPYRLDAGEDVASLYNALHEAVLNGGCPTTVISSECFLEWFDPALVAEQVLPWGIDVKVIIYLRRQDLWIQSVFNQIVKDRFLRYNREFQSMPQYEQMDYKSTLDRWAAAFGKERLIVRVYEKGQLKDDDVIADFLSVLGLLGRFPGTEPEEPRGNPSLHRDVVALLHKANGLPVSLTEHLLLLEAMLPMNDTLLERDGAASFDFVGSELRRRIVESFEASNRAVAQDYLGRGDGVLFRQTP